MSMVIDRGPLTTARNLSSSKITVLRIGVSGGVLYHSSGMFKMGRVAANVCSVRNVWTKVQSLSLITVTWRFVHRAITQ